MQPSLNKYEYYLNNDSEQTGWQLYYDNHNNNPDDTMSSGMRLSTDCLTKRCIEQLDKARYFEFPEHLGHRGHGFERVIAEWIEENFGIKPLREVSINWKYGITHLDLYLPNGLEMFGIDRPVQIELKTNKDGQVSTSNYRQVHRQMFAIQEAIQANDTATYVIDGEQHSVPVKDLYNDCEFIILVIDPATWRIPSKQGYKVEITEQREEELLNEWVAMTKFQNMSKQQIVYALENPSVIGECTCGVCDTNQLLDELPSILDEYAYTYKQCGEEAKLAKQEKEAARDKLKQSLTLLRKHRKENLDEKQKYISPSWIVNITKTGSIRVDENKKKLNPTGTLVSLKELTILNKESLNK